MSDFRAQLKHGRVGESLIAQWFQHARGATVLPVYELERESGKGPQVQAAGRALIAPDMLVFRQERVVWVEAKHKTVFSWHRKSQEWVTGIDLRHYTDYCALQQYTAWPIWLFFLHTSSEPWEGDKPHCPPVCPTGLFANALAHLSAHEHHRDMRHGKSGMVYWAHSALRMIASLEAVRAATRS